MNTFDYIIVVGYILGFLGIGFLFKENKNSEDYFLGGRSMGWFPLSLSTMATQLSAISFISAPAFVGFKEGGGMQWLTYEFGVPLAMAFIMVCVIPTLYKSGVVSVYEYLERRFDSSSRLLISIVFQVSRSFGTGVMVYTVAMIIQSVIPIPFWQTIVVIGVITMIYSYQGGMKAVIWGDVIQMCILFGGILICLFYGISNIGGWDVFVQSVDKERLDVIDFGSMGFDGDQFGFLPMVVGGFFLYASYYGTDQTQIQRQLSAGGMSTIRQLLVVNGLFRFPITLIYCIMGLVLGTLLVKDASFMQAINDTYAENAGSIKSVTDLMVPVFILKYLPNGIIGILFVAILSAAMSSLSSTINSLSAVTTEDFVKRWKPNLSVSEYMNYSKGLSIFWGVVCLVCAFFAGDIADTVIEAINKVGSVFYGPILAAFILALMTKRTTAMGVNIGIVVGVLVNVYLWLGVPEIFWFWWNAIGTVVTLVVAYGYSSLVPAVNSDKPEMEVTFMFDKKSVGILVAFFVAIILFCVYFPSFFGE